MEITKKQRNQDARIGKTLLRFYQKIPVDIKYLTMDTAVLMLSSCIVDTFLIKQKFCCILTLAWVGQSNG